MQTAPENESTPNATARNATRMRTAEMAMGFPSLGDLPNPGIKPRSPTLQADSLPAEPPGKPMNTGVGSLSLLQWIFPTQELNQGLLNCKWILYQLSYKGSRKPLTISPSGSARLRSRTE